MLSDLRFVMRQLRRAPAFTVTAVITLALGIGATTAIFTLVDGVLLKSLPVRSPGELWRAGDVENCCFSAGLPTYNRDYPNDWSLFSYEQYREFRDHTRGWQSLAAFEASSEAWAVRRAGSQQPAAPYTGEWVSGNAFDTLGLRAYAGRLLHASDDEKGAPPVAVMSFDTWQQVFGRDPAIVGSNLLLDGKSVTVVGITPPGFHGERLSPTPTQLWMPFEVMAALSPGETNLDHPELQWLNVIGRVAPGAKIAAIQAQMQVELQQFLRSPMSKVTGPEQAFIPKQYLRLTPGGAGVQRMQEQYKGDLYLLMGISGFVLLIACANLANLMLARSVTQRVPIAVRTALGAPRRRLVERALVECWLLALMGGLAGLLVAWGGAKLILHLAFQNDPISISPDPSWPVLGFALAASALTAMLFGVAPAWLAAHADPMEALRGVNRSTGRQHRWAQQGLVVAQAAVSVVLLCGAGYVILSLNKLEHQHFGFETAHRTMIMIDPQDAGYKPEQLDAMYRELHDQLASIPSVERVAYSLWNPLDGRRRSAIVSVEGRPAPPPGSLENLASWDRVSSDYFQAVGTHVVRGRGFLESDTRTSPNVAVVNESFVRKVLHGKNPIGAHFGDADPSATGIYQIVGVVEDTQYWSPTDPVQPMYFVAAAQWPQLPAGNTAAADYAQFIANTHYMWSWEVETRGPVPDLEARIRRTVAAFNPNLMVVRYQSFAAQVNLAFAQQNMIAQLTSLFGLLALVLAAVGLYGVTAYAVAQRTGEIGIRMALGATRGDVQRMILRGAFLQVGLGLGIGIPAAIAAAHLIAAEMYGTTAYNPLVLGTVVLVLGVSALLAAALPARRAASVEPMDALRSE